MTRLHGPFVGSEALAGGLVRKHELRSRYRLVFPDVYAPLDCELTLRQRTRAAWLWSHRRGVIAGAAASALHGAKWVDDDEPVELAWSNARPPQGIRTYDMRLLADEVVIRDGMATTSVTRTAFDIGRRGPLGDAVARLDALGRARRFDPDDVAAIVERHRGARGSKQLATALTVHDAGAQSPRETWLRLLLLDAGFPHPRTQIPVTGSGGWPRYYLDMGWKHLLLAVEYDGEHHRTDRPSYRRDIIRMEYLQSVGWCVVRVVAGQSRADVVRRVRRAWESRLR